MAASSHRARSTIERLWQPIACDFQLSLASRNPYDPDEADVVGEVEGPDGQHLRHPAYWFEAMRLTATPQGERAAAEGAGGWRWRFSPPSAGTWRWRIVARIKRREAWLETASGWSTTSAVAPA